MHLHVGYTDLRHLAPAFLGVALVAAGLGLSYPYLSSVDLPTEMAWARLRHRGNRPGAGVDPDRPPGGEDG